MTADQLERIKAYPAPGPKPVTIPLVDVPAYLELHQLSPYAYEFMDRGVYDHVLKCRNETE